MQMTDLNAIAVEIRAKLVEMSYRSRLAHLGSALSCVDILVAAYYTALNIDPSDPNDPNRDRLILSKGHAAAALYSVLAHRKIIPDAMLEEYGQLGSILCEHPAPNCAPGIEAATGSLGHGLALCSGLSLASRITGRVYKAWAVLSDGEMNEGSVWESALFAPAHNLDNLVAVVDFNKWQATGRSCEVTCLEPLADKWKAFGWEAVEVDGHDLTELVHAFGNVPFASGKPSIIIAHTVKGKGISFMEDDNNWHYRIPTAEEVILAKKELGLA